MTSYFAACCALFNEIYAACMEVDALAFLVYVLAFHIMLSLFLYLYRGTRKV